MYVHKIINPTVAAIGAPISIDDHVEVILDGLSEKYDSFVRVDQYTIEKIEALLLSQEERFEKHKVAKQSIIQAHCASGSWSSQQNQNNRSRYNESYNKNTQTFSRNKSETTKIITI